MVRVCVYVLDVPTRILVVLLQFRVSGPVWHLTSPASAAGVRIPRCSSLAASCTFPGRRTINPYTRPLIGAVRDACTSMAVLPFYAGSLGLCPLNPGPCRRGFSVIFFTPYLVGLLASVSAPPTGVIGVSVGPIAASPRAPSGIDARPLGLGQRDLSLILPVIDVGVIIVPGALSTSHGGSVAPLWIGHVWKRNLVW